MPPNQGIHKYRIGNVAAFDFLGTILLSFVITWLSGIPVAITLTFLLLLGFLMHYLFNVKTSSMLYLKNF